MWLKRLSSNFNIETLRFINGWDINLYFLFYTWNEKIKKENRKRKENKTKEE